MEKRAKKPATVLPWRQYAMALAAALVSTALASSEFAFAQSGIDPSSALLLNSGNRTSSERPTTSQDSRLDSGRYTTRPRERIERQAPAQATPAAVRRTAPPVVPSPTPAPVEVTVEPADDQGTVVVPINDSASVEEAGRVIEGRKESLLEIGFGAGYLYENSSSSYSYRDYSLAAPVYLVDAKVWLSSEFGVGASTYSTLGATVSDGARDLAATRAEIAAGLFFRKVVSEDRVFVIGFEFQDQQLRVPTDASNRLKLKTTGLRATVAGSWDRWNLGFSIAPKLDHEETSDAGTKSGTAVEAYRVGFELGRRWPFSSSNAMYIRLRHDIEQVSFSGPATSPDRVTGAAPDGVGVTNGTTVIQFGFDWGQ